MRSKTTILAILAVTTLLAASAPVASGAAAGRLARHARSRPRAEAGI